MKLSAPLAVGGMIFFGTSCSLLAKMIYSVQATNIRGETTRFEKPWFQVLAMFMGMSVCILLDLPKPGRSRSRSKKEEETALLSSSPTGEAASSPKSSVWIIGIPTLFDLFATACGTTGLLYTTVSVYQMLRGAMLIWTAVLSILFLGTRLTKYNYGGIVLCIFGVTLVGLANIWAEDDPRSKSDTVFGILIILGGQILQAAQVVMEEFLLQGLRMSSVRIVAWEGVFGIAHCLLWVFPLLYFLPGRDNGHLEDPLDAIFIFTHSLPVAAIIATDMIMMLFYNVCGMEVTDSLSAVHRVVIETLRTLCVWVADLFIFYVLSGGTLGESWTKYSHLQLLGFTFLIAGTVMYNYENLMAEREKTAKKEAPTADLLPTITPATTYDAVEAEAKPTLLHVTKPLQMDGEEEEDVDEDEEQVGSYYGHTVGSVAHSPFLLAASGTPSSFAGSLRHRSSFMASP